MRSKRSSVGSSVAYSHMFEKDGRETCWMVSASGRSSARLPSDRQDLWGQRRATRGGACKAMRRWG